MKEEVYTTTAAARVSQDLTVERRQEKLEK